MNQIIWVPWEMKHEGNKITAVGYASRRQAYRCTQGRNVAMVQVEIIPKKFHRSAEAVPKKNMATRKKKRRK